MSTLISDITKNNIESKIIELLKKHTNLLGRIECAKALAIAKITGVKPLYVGKIATKEGYRISQCELAQFGKKRVGEFDKDTYDSLKKFTDERGKITCENAFIVAKKFGLFKVRSTIKKSDLDVINCQLGCFTEKNKPRLKPILMINIENKNTGQLIKEEDFLLLKEIKINQNLRDVISKFGISSSKLLERIKIIEESLGIKCMKMNYDSLEKAQLTDEAIAFIKKFEEFRENLENVAFKHFRELFYGNKVYRKK